MTNTYNNPGTNGSVMVPVLSRTGSGMAYILYANPQGILQGYYSCMSIPVPFPEHIQAIPGRFNTSSGSTPYEGTSYIHINTFGNTGKPSIQSSLKSKEKAKSASYYPFGMMSRVPYKFGFGCTKITYNK